MTTSTPTEYLRECAASYVRKTSSATVGKRDSTAFSVAGHLYAFVTEDGESLHESEIINLVHGWNATNTDPLPEQEIVKCCQSAMKNGTPRASKIVKMPTKRGRRFELATTVANTRGCYLGAIELDPADPLPTARTFVDSECSQSRLLYHRGTFLRFGGSCYREQSEDVVRAALWPFLAAAVDLDGKPYKPNKNRVANVLDALKATTILSDSITPPAWLDERDTPAVNMIACKNQIINLATGDTRAPTSDLFTLNATDFNYDADAPVPEAWLGFLNELWHGDPESIRTLQRWFGYCLTPATRLQKALLVVGPKRSGKGTIARVLSAMLGHENVAGPSLASFSANFGLWPLIGKLVAVVSDARLSGHADQAAIVERLLSITGEDAITVDRKNMQPLTLTLPTRIMLLTNELPRFTDSSGALASRFIVLRLTESFYGRENHNLTDRLLDELPGILNWAIAGWRDLNDQGRFDQPTTAADIITEWEDLSSPIMAFVRDRCEVGPDCQVEVSVLYAAWKSWCEDNGKSRPGTKQTFGRDLRAAVYPLDEKRPILSDGSRVRVYVGIGIMSAHVRDEPLR